MKFLLNDIMMDLGARSMMERRMLVASTLPSQILASLCRCCLRAKVGVKQRLWATMEAKV